MQPELWGWMSWLWFENQTGVVSGNVYIVKGDTSGQNHDWGTPCIIKNMLHHTTTTYRPPHSPSLKTFYFVSLSQMKLKIKGSCFDHIKNQIKRDMSLICQYYTTVLYSGRHTGSRVLPKRYIYKVRAKFQWARIFNYFLEESQNFIISRHFDNFIWYILNMQLKMLTTNQYHHVLLQISQHWDLQT